jgi:sterol 24-C-methyltransferase
MTLKAAPAKIDELVAKVVKYTEENTVLVGVTALATVATGYFVFRKPSMRRDGNDYDSQLTGTFKILNNSDHTLKTDEFKTSINDYEGMFSGARKTTGLITDQESIDVRKQKYADMVNHFYNLVTDFYEWGWGQSFHFAPRFHNEDFISSLKRAEYYLCARLGMKRGTRALDVGCGVGGPMRNMAVFSDSFIEGITINQYQVNIGNKYNAQNGLSHLCSSRRGDFQDLPWPAETFDCAYAIEATCHSPDRVKTFSGIARVLKPDGLFAGYEWVMLDKYDPNNKDHVRIKEGIEVGNGLPTLQHYSHIIECLEKSGFEVIEYRDVNEGVHAPNQIPWYQTLNGSLSISGFRMTWMGRLVTHTMVWTLELLRVAPPGSTQVSALLNATALDLVDGGKQEIFTPSFFFLARKK